MEANMAPVILENTNNKRKIPKSLFIENIEEFTKEHGVDNTLKSLNQAYKYDNKPI